MELHPAAIRIAQLHRFQHFAKGTGEIDALPRRQGLPEIQPLARIVVAADCEHRNALSAQQRKKAVEQADSFRGRYGFVINITGDDNSIHTLCPRHLRDLLQNKALILQHGERMHAFAQMQIAEM